MPLFKKPQPVEDWIRETTKTIRQQSQAIESISRAVMSVSDTLTQLILVSNAKHLEATTKIETLEHDVEVLQATVDALFSGSSTSPN